MTHLTLENSKTVGREQLSLLRIDFWCWHGIVGHRFFFGQTLIKMLPYDFHTSLKCPRNAYILLSAMECLSYLEGWYYRLVSLTWVLEIIVTVLFRPMSGNGTWPEAWPLGPLEASDGISASFKTQLFSVNNYWKSFSKQIHCEVVFISLPHKFS